MADRNIYVPGTITVEDDLETIVLEVAVEDLQTILRAVAAQAITEQIRLGNPVTNIIVDNSGRRDITTAQKRIQAFFTNKEQLRVAVYQAWAIIQRLTRVLTGRAQSSYQLWFNNSPIGASPAACEIYLDRMTNKDAFRIVGPVIVYGRKIYWNPATNGKRQKFKKRIALKTASSVFKVVRTKGIMTQAAEQVKRTNRGIAVAESWVTTSALPKDGRTPALYLGFKKRGAVNG